MAAAPTATPFFTPPTLGESVGDVGSAIGSFGAAVSDLYSAEGAKAEQSALEEAAGLAGNAAGLAGQAAGIAASNIPIEEASTALQVFQQQRSLSSTIGTQKAQVGASGFAASGSALDLLASSYEQGAIQKGVLTAQGAITENAYREQEVGYQTQQQADLAQQATDLGQAQAAGSAAKADKLGAITSFAKGALAIAPLALLL